MPKHDPERTCISCRAAGKKQELLRFVLSPDNVLVPDLMGKLPGRGAYTCMAISCLKRAVEKKQFNRSFRGEVKEIDPSLLINNIQSVMKERVASWVSLANKAGKVTAGTDMALDRMKEGEIGFIFIASDISADIGEKVRARADRNGIECSSLFNKEKLGALTGREMKSVLAIQAGGFITPLKQEAAKLRNFFEEGR